MMDSEDSSFEAALGKFVADVVDEDTARDDREFQELLDQLSRLQDKYVEEKYISEGGMKKIMRVQDTATLRSVAMAVLKGAKKDRNKILNFFREARITALLEHPNIVPVYEISHKNGEPYFTMKEIHGETLGEILKKLSSGDKSYIEKYPLSALLNIFLKVCDAIAYAHSRKIIHLDLKPDNIHVGEFGEVLVIDWGLAKNLNEETVETDNSTITSEIDVEHTMDGFVKGTIGYMAPEQARGENDRKDEKTDIYALGAILYSVLSFKAPYDNTNVKKALKKIALGQYDSLPGTTPEALNAVVKKAMSRAKKNRYGNVTQLSDDVVRYLNGFATEAQEANFTKQLKLFILRHKLTFSLVSAFLVILVVVTSLFISSLQESEKEARKNELEARKNEMIAREKEKEAKQHFRNLVAAVNAKKELTTVSVPLAVKKSEQTLNHGTFEEAYQILMDVYSEDIEDTEYWRKLGEIYVGRLDFENASRCLKRSLSGQTSGFNKDKTKRIIDTIGTLKIEKGKIQAFLNFIKKAGRMYHMHLVLGNMFHTVYNTWELTPGQQEKVFKESIEMLNVRGPLNYKIRRIKGEFAIDLSNNPNLTNISPICGFPVFDLSVANCRNLREMKWIRGDKIRFLNLANTKSPDYRFLLHLDNLEELKLNDIVIHSLVFRRVGLKRLDFTGAVVNLIDVFNPRLEELNLCSSKADNLDQLELFTGLKKIILPPNSKLTPETEAILKKRNVLVKKCNCDGAKNCKIPR